MRIKNINTQRVLGARRNSLRFIIASEAVVIAFLSWLIAVLSVSLFSHTQPANLVDADLSLAAHPLIVGGTALVALLTGVFAGVYPAHYMTSFAPVLVLKGSFGLSPKGKKLRNTLMSIQFAASFALIIGASFMYLQNHFMQNSSLGYEKDALVTVNIRELQGNRDAFTNQLKTFAGIDGVTYAYDLLSSSDSYMRWAREYKGEEILFQCLPVDYTFLNVTGIEVTEGRDFRREDVNMTGQGVYIFNETARAKFNMDVDTRIGGREGVIGLGEIIGFMPDIKSASFRVAIEPMGFYVVSETQNGLDNAYIKLHEGTNLRAAIAHIQSTLAAFNPDYTFTIRFFDEVLQRLYEKETALSSLISLFSMIAIFISIVGVFGLVVFDSECRRKEIGIRKVLGASVLGIIIMFNKAYFRILLICFVIAAPLAWYAVTRWLENFAYKTPMHWWVYLLAFVAVGIITGATVTFQNWRVANDDPVKAIKSE
jgi:putative ABC transport system permease protein